MISGKLKVKNQKLKIFNQWVFFFILILTFNLLPLTCLYSASNDSDQAYMQEKAKVEDDYKKQIIYIVERIVGPNKAVVIVQAELQVIRLSGKTEKKQGSADQQNPFSGMQSKPKVLPGFDGEAATESSQPSGSGKSEDVAQKAEQTIVRTVLNALRVTILLDKGQVAKKKIIEDTLTKSVGASLGAGKFLLSIVAETAFSSTSFLTPLLENPLALVLLILGFLFLIVLLGPLRSVLMSFATAFSESKKGGEFTVLSKTESKAENAGTGSGGGGGGGGSGTGGSGSTTEMENEEEGEAVKKKEKPFEFINKENLKNLIYLIQEEQPEVIALIVTYLDAELSAEVIGSLSPDLQLQTALCIVSVKLTSEEDVYKIHEKIKKKIDFLVGGIDAFIKIIEQVDNRVRTEMLSSLEKQSPRLAKKVRESIFAFEDLANLPDQTVQFIMREIKTDRIAIALKGVGVEAVKQKILSNMSEGGRLLLKEEMDFGRPATQQQIEEVQREIEKMVKKMENERKIVLRKEEASTKKGFEVEGRLQKLDIGEEYNTQQTQQTQQTQRTQQAQPSGESPQRAIEYYNAGITAYSSGKIDDAIHYFQRSVEYNSNFWQAWQYLGSCLHSKGRTEEAIKSYEKSLAMNPSNTQLRDWLQNEKQKRTAAK